MFLIVLRLCKLDDTPQQLLSRLSYSFELVKLYQHDSLFGVEMSSDEFSDVRNEINDDGQGL